MTKIYNGILSGIPGKAGTIAARHFNQHLLQWLVKT
jgi:hypothetical protein